MEPSIAERIDLQTCGWDFIGVKNKILNPDSSGQGEICTVGRNIFMGYIWEEGKTADAFTDDDEAWYKSGDMGRFVFSRPRYVDKMVHDFELQGSTAMVAWRSQAASRS